MKSKIDKKLKKLTDESDDEIEVSLSRSELDLSALVAMDNDDAHSMIRNRSTIGSDFKPDVPL